MAAKDPLFNSPEILMGKIRANALWAEGFYRADYSKTTGNRSHYSQYILLAMQPAMVQAVAYSMLEPGKLSRIVLTRTDPV